jgi:hypothetical protein
MLWLSMALAQRTTYKNQLAFRALNLDVGYHKLPKARRDTRWLAASKRTRHAAAVGSLPLLANPEDAVLPGAGDPGDAKTAKKPSFHDRWGQPSGLRPDLMTALRLEFRSRHEYQKDLWLKTPVESGVLAWAPKSGILET